MKKIKKSRSFMKKLKSKMDERKQAIEINIKMYTELFNFNFPGWDIGPDADYVRKRIEQTANVVSRNRRKKKWRILKRENFDIWPFPSESIMIIQTSKKWISCLIDMKEYALNKVAATGLKIQHILDYDFHIDQKDIFHFIDIGLKL